MQSAIDGLKKLDGCDEEDGFGLICMFLQIHFPLVFPMAEDIRNPTICGKSISKYNLLDEHKIVKMKEWEEDGTNK